MSTPLRVAAMTALFALTGPTACKRGGSGPPSRALAERVRARLVEEVPTAQVRVVDADTLVLKAGEGELQVNLENTRLRCEVGEEACAQTLDALAANAKASLESMAEGSEAFDPATVRLTLKTADWVENANKMSKERFPEKFAENELVSEAFVGELRLVYVADLPKGMRMLQQADLPKLEVDAQGVRALALKNLKEAFPAVKMAQMEQTGVWTNEEGNDYDSALMALPELWQPLARQVGGKLVVGVPSRNRVFAAGTREPTQVRALGKLTSVAHGSEDHPLSAKLYAWSESGWTVHRP